MPYFSRVKGAGEQYKIQHPGEGRLHVCKSLCVCVYVCTHICTVQMNVVGYSTYLSLKYVELCDFLQVCNLSSVVLAAVVMLNTLCPV